MQLLKAVVVTLSWYCLLATLIYYIWHYWYNFIQEAEMAEQCEKCVHSKKNWCYEHCENTSLHFVVCVNLRKEEEYAENRLWKQGRVSSKTSHHSSLQEW